MHTSAQRDIIKKALAAEGYSLQRVARDMNVSASMITSVIAGRSRSRRVENHVANILNKKPETIWNYREDTKV